MNYKLPLILFITTTVLWSCSKDKTEEIITPFTCTEEISFSSQVLPLIELNCSTSGCHNATGGAGGIILTNHTNISERMELILKTIRHESDVVPMPLGGPQLTPEQIGLFSCWIEQGAPNN